MTIETREIDNLTGLFQAGIDNMNEEQSVTSYVYTVRDISYVPAEGDKPRSISFQSNPTVCKTADRAIREALLDIEMHNLKEIVEVKNGLFSVEIIFQYELHLEDGTPFMRQAGLLIERGIFLS